MTAPSAPPNTLAVRAPMQGTVVSVDVRVGDRVAAGAELAVIEAMKMEHLVVAQTGGIVRRIEVAPGELLAEGQAVIFLEPVAAASAEAGRAEQVDLDAIRPDLAEALARHALGLDAARPEAVERRRKTGQRTTRENVDDLVDPGSFIEYGALALAAPPSLARGAPAHESGRRARGRHRLRERRPVRRREVALHGDRVRLHRVRRYAGHDESQEEGPHAQDRGGVAPPDRDLRGRRRRSTGGHRLDGRRRPRHPHLRDLRAALGPRAAGRNRVRPLLRGERGAARLLRRDHRDAQREHRHGRTRDDRRRRARRVRARRGGADRRAGAEWCGRPRGRGRGRGGAQGEAVPRLLPGSRLRLARAGPAPAAQADSGEPPARLRRAHGDRDALRRGLGARAPPRLRDRDRDGAGAARGAAVRSPRQQPAPPGRRDRRARRRQSRALPPALRRVRAARALALRHTRLHGRARGREARAGAPRLAHVRHLGEPLRPLLHRGAAQGLRTRRAGHDGRELSLAFFYRGVADG